MTTVFWTGRAQADLAAIHAFIEVDSPHFAKVVVRPCSFMDGPFEFRIDDTGQILLGERRLMGSKNCGISGFVARIPAELECGCFAARI